MSESVLVVCTGNVCRSPYLHRRLGLALAGTGIDVVSAGTGALVDAPMDPPMAELLGPDADPAFRARALTRAIVEDSGLVLTATRAHRSLVARTAPTALRRTVALADFAQLADTLDDDAVAALAGRPLAERVAAVLARRPAVAPLSADRADVPDPYRRAPEVYATAAARIDELVPSVVRVLR